MAGGVDLCGEVSKLPLGFFSDLNLNAKWEITTHDEEKNFLDRKAAHAKVLWWEGK